MSYFDHKKSFTQRHETLLGIFAITFGTLGALAGAAASIYLGVIYFPGTMMIMSATVFPVGLYVIAFAAVSYFVGAGVGIGLASLIGLAVDGGCLLLDFVVDSFNNLFSKPTAITDFILTPLKAAKDKISEAAPSFSFGK